VRAALVACDDVNQFIDQFPNHQPPISAAISDTFTLIDIGARAAMSAAAAATCKPHHPWKKCTSVKSRSDTEFGFYSEMQEYSEMHVTCKQAPVDVHNEPTSSEAFVGIVMLQFLPLSGIAAADADDGHEFRRSILEAAANVESAVNLGLTTSLAGDYHAVTAIQAISQSCVLDAVYRND
jgi:hypothetical protein